MKLPRLSPLAKDLRSEYPKGPPPLSGGLFGPPRIDFPSCTGCQKCVAACPTTALTAHPHPGEPPGKLLFLSLTNCLFCERCQDACEDGVIKPEQTFEVAARERAHIEQAGLLPEASLANGATAPPSGSVQEPHSVAGAGVSEPSAALEPVATRDVPPGTPRRSALRTAGVPYHPEPSLPARSGALEQTPLTPPVARPLQDVNGLFRRSLRVFAVNAGSCGGCEEELFAAAGPCYDFARLGIDLVDSPRHADALFVTGPVTRNLEGPLREVYEAVPEPRLVIAAGACAGDGNVFRGSYATLGPLDRVLPVDVYLPGCPPSPNAILHGLLLAMERAEERLRQRVEYVAPGFQLSQEVLSTLSPPRPDWAAPKADPLIESPSPLPAAHPEAPLKEPEGAAPQTSPQEHSSSAPEAPAALHAAWDTTPAASPSKEPSAGHPAAEVTTSSYSVSSNHDLPAVSAADAVDLSAPPTARVKTLPWMGAVTHVSVDDPAPQDAPPTNTAGTPPAPSSESDSSPRDQGSSVDLFEDIPTLSGSRLIPSLSALSQTEERGEDSAKGEEGPEKREEGGGAGEK